MPTWLYFYLHNPLGQAISIVVLALLLMLIFRPRAGMIGVILASLYAVGNPIFNVAVSTYDQGWWWRTLLSFPALFTLVLVLALISSKLTSKGKDSGGGTAFVLPALLYPPILFITALVRLVQWLIVPQS